jgi:hypothetical protein
MWANTEGEHRKSLNSGAGKRFLFLITSHVKLKKAEISHKKGSVEEYPSDRT